MEGKGEKGREEREGGGGSEGERKKLSFTLAIKNPAMTNNGVKARSSKVSLQSSINATTNPPTNVASHWMSKPTLSPIPSWILSTSLQ